MGTSTRTLAIGDFAPFFFLEGEPESFTALRDEAGVPVLLIFYSNDQVSECADILRALRDRYAEFQDQDIEIIAISCNSASERQAFKEANDIPFRLLCDPNTNMCRKFGVCFDQEEEGKPPVGTFTRSAILLDRDLR